MASTVSHVGSVISGATGTGTPTHTTVSSFTPKTTASRKEDKQIIIVRDVNTGKFIEMTKGEFDKAVKEQKVTKTSTAVGYAYTKTQEQPSLLQQTTAQQKVSQGLPIVPKTQEQFLKQQRDFFMPSISAKEEENTYQGLLTSEYEKLQTKAAKEYETKGKLDEYASLFGVYHGKYTSVNKEQFLSATSDIQRKAERDVNRLAYGRIFQNELSEETTKYYDITKTDKGYLMTPKQDAFNQVAQDVGYKETAPVYLIPNQKEISEKLALTVPISTQVAEDKSLWEKLPVVGSAIEKANIEVSRMKIGKYPIFPEAVNPKTDKTYFQEYMESGTYKPSDFEQKTLGKISPYLQKFEEKVEDFVPWGKELPSKVSEQFFELGRGYYEKIKAKPVSFVLTAEALAVLATTLKVLGASSEALGVTKVATKIASKLPVAASIKNVANIPKAMGWLYSASVGARVATSEKPARTAGEILASELLPMAIGFKTGEMILGSKAFAPKLVIKDIKSFSTVDTIYKGVPEAGIPREIKGTTYAKGKGYVSEVFGIKRTPVEIEIETPYTQLGKTDLTLKPISSLFIGGKESRIGEGITKIKLTKVKGDSFVKIKGISKEGYTFPDAKVSLPPETMMPQEAISGEIFFKQKPLVTTLRTKPITAKTKLTSDLFMETPADKTLYFESYKIGKTTVPEIEQEAIFDIDQILYHGKPKVGLGKITLKEIPVYETRLKKTPSFLDQFKQKIVDISMDIVKPYRKIKVTKEMEDFGWMKPFKPATPTKDFISSEIGQPSTILEQPKPITKGIQKAIDRSLLMGQEAGKAVSGNILDIQIKRMAKVLPYEPQFYQRTPSAEELIFLGLPVEARMPRADELIVGGINEYLKNLEGFNVPSKELETEYKFISTEKGKDIFKEITKMPSQKSIQNQFQIPFQAQGITPVQDLTFEQGQTQITKHLQLQAPEISLKYKQRPNIFEDIFVPTSPPIIIPPLLPWFPRGTLFERGKKGKPVEVTPEYKPSLMALELGIKGKATKETLQKKELTGLQIRKLPKGFKFEKLPSLNVELNVPKLFGRKKKRKLF